MENIRNLKSINSVRVEGKHVQRSSDDNSFKQQANPVMQPEKICNSLQYLPFYCSTMQLSKMQNTAKKISRTGIEPVTDG